MPFKQATNLGWMPGLAQTCKTSARPEAYTCVVVFSTLQASHPGCDVEGGSGTVTYKQGRRPVTESCCGFCCGQAINGSLAGPAAHGPLALKALGHCLLQASLLQRQS